MPKRPLPPDHPSFVNPMITEPVKLCISCGNFKPNDFQHFGKKWFKTRHDFTTVSICLKCRNGSISKGLIEHHANKVSKSEALYAMRAEEAKHRAQQLGEIKFDHETDEEFETRRKGIAEFLAARGVTARPVQPTPTVAAAPSTLSSDEVKQRRLAKLAHLRTARQERIDFNIGDPGPEIQDDDPRLDEA